MRIIAYFINYNDSFYIPFLAKHYLKFCEKVIMFDNYSSDGSRAVAELFGFEVRLFGRPGILDDQHYLDVKNHCWKEQRGKGIDFVIIVDADEFVFIDSLHEENKIPKVTGYNMISEILPQEDITEIKTGDYSESYSKQAIFNPDAMIEINYVHGCHVNRMVSESEKSGECRLLHYRQIGGVQRMLDRHAAYRKRLSPFNLKHKMGVHYTHSDEAKFEEWKVLTSQAKELW